MDKLDEIIDNVLGKSNIMVDIDARSMAAPPKPWDERQCPCCGKWIVRFQDFFSNYCKAKHISFPGGPLPGRGDPVYNDVMKLWDNPVIAILCCKCEKKAAGEYEVPLDWAGAPGVIMTWREEETFEEGCRVVGVMEGEPRLDNRHGILRRIEWRSNTSIHLPRTVFVELDATGEVVRLNPENMRRE